jgi:glycosyltransferase involved in cell wall biosynthesis
MAEVYQQAHITIIPTVHSEGTSLSCLEALASRNAVIATNVGGLPNLILPEYNGLLIDPSAPSLVQALERLIEDPGLRERFGKRGRQVALSFSIKRWRVQWEQIIAAYLSVGREDDFKGLKVSLFPLAPGISWEGVKQRPHHLASQFAQAGIETFWQNPTRRSPSPHPLLHILGPDDDLYLHRPILWVYYPFTYRLLDQFENPYVVYDVLDDISIHEVSDRDLPEGRRAVDYHQKLLREADLVTTSSLVLYQRLKDERPDVLYIANGVDLAHFNPERYAPAHGRAGGEHKPVIGFHGAIAGWFDLDLLYKTARMRTDYQFRLFGDVSIYIDRLTQLPNVDYLGRLDYEEMPEQVAKFDVGILPFKVNHMTHAVRPLKVLECLAMGKPVVAVPLQELTTWPGVFLAATPEAFAEKLDIALGFRKSMAEEPEVREFIRAAGWSETARPLLERLQQLDL